MMRQLQLNCLLGALVGAAACGSEATPGNETPALGTGGTTIPGTTTGSGAATTGNVGSGGSGAPVTTTGTASGAGTSNGGAPVSNGGAAPSSGGSVGAGGTPTAMAGSPAVGGSSGSGVGGTSAMAGADSGGSGGGGGTPNVGDDPRPWFSFFTTSMAGLLRLKHGPDVNVDVIEDLTLGFGGDLGGLAGADEICMQLAQQGNPGDTKTWRAFLSVNVGPDGGPVNAIDRIGTGPWYDWHNRLLANNIAELLPPAEECPGGGGGMFGGGGETGGGRPPGADPELAAMFTDEHGDPISPDTSEIDNHDTLTGSECDGTLDVNGNTCQDWTSSASGQTGPKIGHAWPRSANNGRHWVSEHSAGGCGVGVEVRVTSSTGNDTVSSGGGFGGFYCFAVNE